MDAFKAVLFKEGLEDVVVARTRLSQVDGRAGRLTIAGYQVDELAPAVSFEAATYLLWHDRLPDPRELESFARGLAEARSASPFTLEVLRRAAARGTSPIDALRLGVASLAMGDDEPTPVRILAGLPTMVAAHARLLAGAEPIEPDPALGHSAAFLAMLRGQVPSQAEARALDTYLNTVIDHGLNASTFTARVIASTGSDLLSAVEGALGALKGPLHGGAPGPALEAFERLREQPGDLDANTRDWVRRSVAAGERIMGFGHRVYAVRDPRADVLGAAAAELLRGTGLYEAAQIHERAVLETLAELKPGRRLATNVEFYTALLLHGLGLRPSIFTAIFAMSRCAGWIAHVHEQRATGRLLRPSSEYVGATDRQPLGVPAFDSAKPVMSL